MVRPAIIHEVQGLIRSVQRKITVYFSTTLRRSDLTIAQFALLVQLSQRSPQKMSELAARLYVSLPAVTHLVDRLIAKGMVTRADDPSDRRICLIRMTAKASRVVRETQGYLLQIFTGSLDGLNAREHDTVLRFYQQFSQALDRRLE